MTDSGKGQNDIKNVIFKQRKVTSSLAI